MEEETQQQQKKEDKKLLEKEWKIKVKTEMRGEKLRFPDEPYLQWLVTNGLL
jgi:hypothetical protein